MREWRRDQRGACVLRARSGTACERLSRVLLGRQCMLQHHFFLASYWTRPMQAHADIVPER